MNRPIRLPTKGIWVSAQNGDSFGDIVATRNIDLQLDGKAKLARKAMALFSYGASYDSLAAVDPGVQGTFLAGCTGIGNGSNETNTSYLYWLTTLGVYSTRLDLYGTSTYLPTGSNTPTFGVDSDIVMFQGKPHVSGGQYVADLNIGFSTWNQRRISGLTTGVPHPLCVIEQLNQLAVGNGNKVQSYDTSYSLQYTMTLPSEYYVTTLRWRQNNLYIGTRHINGGEAKMFIWNGSGVAAQSGYGCGADWIYSMADYNGRMYILTSAGQLRSHNGAGFDDAANFPVFYTPYTWGITTATNYGYGRVANRGMAVYGSFLYINIDGGINVPEGILPGAYLPNQPSGLWQYSPRSGLWHKAGVNYNSRLRLVPTGRASSYLTFSTAHQASTGDPVAVAAGTMTGVNDGQVYYAVVNSTTSFALALSPADALAGRIITLGGSVSTTVCLLARYETLGNGTVTNPGAIVSLSGMTISPLLGSEVIFGSGVYDSTLGITKAAINSLGMGRNRGSFTTARLSPAEFTAFFQKLSGFIDLLTLPTDQILVKYRTQKRASSPSALAFSGTGATWTSATTFTVDSTQKDVKNIQVGDEIECVSGTNAGYTCHVVSIDTSSPTYVFTVDESMPTASGTFDFVADNWTKGPTFDSTSLADFRTGFHAALKDVSGNWIQFKVELRGFDVSLQELMITNAPKQ